MANLIGKSLGRYHILEQLGEGGMATVYKAYDTRLEREVAIKIIRKGAFPSDHIEHILKRFEREAKALARLSHPNIVKVHDFGEHESSPYLVMEYLQSGTLKKKMGKPMPWQEAVRILIPVAEALEYAHEQKIIHRDIKPSNILLTQKGQPMLTDFGIAKILDLEETLELTGTSAAVGTPEYMAPEQASSKTVDHRADIYSLGVVFYEMVTGRKPYTADTPMAVIIKQASEPLPRPRSFAPNLPQEAENILLKALAKNPKDRYQDMGEFAHALEGLAAGKAGAKRTVTPKNNEASARPPAKRAEFKFPSIPHKTLITAGIITLILVGLFAVFSKSLSALPAQTLATSTPKATNIPPPTATQELGIGSTWTRPADGMEMVYVPGGEFTMGSNDWADDEKPVHQVYLDAYWIDRTEVTNAKYRLCVQAGNCKNPASSERSSEYDEHPVTYIKWEDAQSYCSWAEARLPTEAEWEKAARGSDGRIFPWGNDKDPTKYNFGKPVGSYPSGASPYGALDMAGSVREWVNDWYSENYYRYSPASNPLGPDTGKYRVLRGGSWVSYDNSVRSAIRSWNNLTDTGGSYGFRCARSLP